MNTAPESRWYHEPLMWLVVAIPLATVIAGFVTLWLASRSPDSVIAPAGPQGPAIAAADGRAAVR